MTHVIVGGGFVGTTVACHLLRDAPSGSRIILINGGGGLARGLAYGTNSPLHLLNVPAARMSWDSIVQNDFVDWLALHGVNCSGSSFVPRAHYGAYLLDTLHQHVAARPDVSWQHMIDYATSLRRCPGGHWELHLLSGERVQAKSVVVALGNFSPSCPHRDLLNLPTRCYASNPWSDEPLAGLSHDSPVAIIGTGLTMLDLLISLKAQNHHGPILALSRRGLLPQVHRSNELPSHAWTAPAEWLDDIDETRGLFRQVRAAIESSRQSGHDWRDIWVELRSRTPNLWQRLSGRNRAQFLRHAQVLWDAHRHRAAPEAMQVLMQLRTKGKLQIAAGRLQSVTAEADGANLIWRSRNAKGLSAFHAERIFNCTGPSTRPEDDRTALFASLASQDRLAPCPLGLGVQTDNSYHLLDGQGNAQSRLYYAGPMLRAKLWEATAVPELREHTRRLARIVLNESS